MSIIDGTFHFLAFNPCNKKIYTGANAVLFAADDKALLTGALQGYRKECIAQNCGPKHIKSIDLLIGRVSEFQENCFNGVIDRKFIILAASTIHGKYYTEKNSILFAAKDVAVLKGALPAYRKECVRLEYNTHYHPQYIYAIDNLIEWVEEFQQTEVHVPDTDTECEIARCIKGVGIER